MTKPTYNRTLECALYYISQGWLVLPLYTIVNGKCSCGKANCNSPGKHPHAKFAPNGAKDATTNRPTVEKWFDGSLPLNVGVCAGEESGLILLDIDPEHGGDESIKQYEPLPPTLEVATGGGGRHYYFSHPGGEVRNSAGMLGKGLDVRGHHGYVVAPPSNHASGGTYSWKIDPRAIEIANCPDWILHGKAKPKQSQKAISEPGKIEEGERNATLTSMAGTMRRRGMSKGAILAALLEENRSICNPPLERTEVGQIADSVAKYPAGDSEDSAGKVAKGKTQASKLIDLASNVELFHNAEDDAFATVTIGGHSENWRIKTKKFRQWLARKFWEKYRKAPGAQAMQDALCVLAGQAIYDGPEKVVHVRLAKHEEAIWLDLGNKNWEAVKITHAGWEVVANPPVKFLRPRGLLSLPHPTDHERHDRLQKFLNLSDYNDWALLLSWMVAALKPTGPYPVLVVNGEQGSAKSTLCRLLKFIIDPNSAPLRATPREVRDLMITASNSWILAFDNLSHIPSWLSDALCRLATGGGFATRELYSDNEEMIFDVMRPVIVNGIAELATRPDLLDRAICLTLPTIPDDKRETEGELWHKIKLQRPQILGALLGAISSAMKTLPSVNLPCPPRMADFATWSVAAEESLGLIHGAFLTAYTANRESATDLAIEVSPIGPTIQEFMDDRSSWEGTAQELLDQLEENHCSERDKTRRDWPKTPQALGKALRRIAPNMRRSDIDVKFDRGTGKKRKRLIHLEQIDILTSEPSELSETTLNNVQINNTSDMLDVSDKKIQSNSCCEANLIGEVRTDDQF